MCKMEREGGERGDNKKRESVLLSNHLPTGDKCLVTFVGKSHRRCEVIGSGTAANRRIDGEKSSLLTPIE